MGANGGFCISKCAKIGEKYNYCQTTTNNWDYCSAVEGKGAYGSSCRSDHPCGEHGSKYTWCYTDNKNSWDYCSINVSEFSTSLTIHGYHCLSACMPNSDDNYYYCYDFKSWDYCSPRISRTYKDKACRADHACEKYGEKYFWCYTSTENDWDYCSPLTNCAYWPAPFTPNKKNKRKKRGLKEICHEHVGDSSGRAGISFYIDPDAHNRVTKPGDTSETTRAQVMIAQCNVTFFRGNEEAGTLCEYDYLGLRIDLLSMINSNGKRYANIQLKTSDQRCVSLAAVLIRTNTSFFVRHIRRALVESLEMSVTVIVDKHEPSSK